MNAYAMSCNLSGTKVEHKHFVIDKIKELIGLADVERYGDRRLSTKQGKKCKHQRRGVCQIQRKLRCHEIRFRSNIEEHFKVIVGVKEGQG